MIRSGGAGRRRIALRRGRRFRGVRTAAVGHGMVELGLVLGEAQALEELEELLLLLFEPAQGLGTIFVERAVAARGALGCGVRARVAAVVVMPTAPAAVCVLPASHPSAP